MSSLLKEIQKLPDNLFGIYKKSFVLNRIDNDIADKISTLVQQGTNLTAAIDEVFDEIQVSSKIETEDDFSNRENETRELKEEVLYNYGVAIKETKKIENNKYAEFINSLRIYRNFDKLFLFEPVPFQNTVCEGKIPIQYYEEPCIKKCYSMEKTLTVLFCSDICYSIDFRGQELEDYPFLLNTTLPLIMENAKFPLQEMIYCPNVLIIKNGEIFYKATQIKKANILIVPFINNIDCINQIVQFAQGKKYVNVLFDKYGKETLHKLDFKKDSFPVSVFIRKSRE